MIEINESIKDNYNVFVGKKLSFVILGTPGKYKLRDTRPHGHVDRTCHTLHAAFGIIMDELIQEGVNG